LLAGHRRLGHANNAWRAGWFGLACDDLRLVGLKLIFLIVTRAVSVLGLSRREAWWKGAEIVMLRHQLAVALRERPRAHSRLGATKHPVQSWVVQQARNLLMDLVDAGMRAKFVLHDRDATFTQAFDAVFQAAGIRIIRSSVQAPRMNSVMERWIGSCRRELLDRTLIWNQRHLMMARRPPRRQARSRWSRSLSAGCCLPRRRWRP
jgi:hypothetical protein